MCSQRNIHKETRARSLLHHTGTIKLICEVIYKETGCEKCRTGHFCSRDGNAWCCLPYATIADRLNTDTNHRTQRGGLWQGKTIRDQITKRAKRVSPKERDKWIAEENAKRDGETIWESLPIEKLAEVTDPDDILSKALVAANIGSLADIDLFIEDIRGKLQARNEAGLDSIVMLIPSKK